MSPNDPLDDLADDLVMDRLIQATLDVEPSPDFLTRVRTTIATSTIDQEIQEDLKLDPSPEFVARVRHRIQEGEPTYVGSGLSRILSRQPVVESGFSRIAVGSGFSRIVTSKWALGAGALATAAVLTLLMVRPANDAVTLVPASTQARSDIALPAPLPVPSMAPAAPASVSPQEVIRPVASRPHVVVAAQPETERLPAATPSEIEGLRQFVAAARRGLVDDSLMALPTLNSEQPLDPVPALSIASLSVDALDH